MTRKSEKLHQQMWDFVYGLLSEKEAAEVNALITSDPDAARAYALVKQQSEMLATAARLEQPPVVLRRPTARQSAVVPPPPPLSAGTGAVEPGPSAIGRQRSPVVRAVNWLVGLAATALVALAAFEYLHPASPIRQRAVQNAERRVAQDHLRVVVTGPQQLQAGVPAYFDVATSAANGVPLRSEVQYAVYSPAGEPLLDETRWTDADGRCQIPLPGDVPTNSRLEVHTFHGRSDARFKTYLQVEKVRYATQLSLDKPLYRPGETVYYRSLTLSRFGLKPDRDLPVRFQILDPGGATVDGCEIQGVTDYGVGNGAFTIPPHQPGGTYTLVASSLDESFPEERREFSIRRYRLPRLKKELEFTRDSYAPGDAVVADFLAQRAEGGPAAQAELRITAHVDEEKVYSATAQAASDGTYQVRFDLPEEIEKGAGTLVVVVDDGGTRETIAKTVPINLGRVEMQFYPEGGDLVAGLENRVYFYAHDPLGEPVHVQGRVLDGQGDELATLETVHEGRGVFALTPELDERYHVEIISPSEVEGTPELPVASEARSVVLNTGAGVFSAGEPIEFDMQTTKERLPLVVSAVCRGVQVGQREVVTDAAKGRTSVSMPVPDEVAGVVRVTVYDYSAKPPQPLAERLVYRRPQRKLNVQVTDPGQAYSPGDAVQLSLQVTDETGEPVPAALGVSVVDDALLNLADDRSPEMTTHFLLTTEIENPADLEDANFYLSEETDAAAALDLLLGTQGWRRFVELTLDQIAQAADAGDDPHREQIDRLVQMEGTTAPPRLFDNLAEVQDEYASAVSAFHAQREETLRQVGRILCFGGIGVLVVLTLIALVRMAGGVSFWLPTLAAATTCLVIGVFWSGARVDSQGQIALRPFVLIDQSSSMQVALGEKDEEEMERWKELAGEDDDLVVNDPFGNGFDDVLTPDAQPADEPLPEGEEEKLAKNELVANLERLGPAMDELGEALGDWEAGIEREDGRGPGWGGGKDMHWVTDLSELGRMREQLRRVAQAGDEKAVFSYSKLLEENLERFRLPVRQYAHQHQPGEPGVRSDFTETVYWHPLLIADRSGRATITFDLSDSVTTFRVRADAHGTGRLGSMDEEIISRIPFSLEPKLPLEVNAGDRIDLPLAVNNDTRGDLPVVVTLKLEHGKLLEAVEGTERELTLAAGQRGREYFPLRVVGQIGDADLEVHGLAGRLADAVKKSIKVVPPGFPMAQSFAGRLEGEQQLTVTMPKRWVKGSLQVTLQVFPSSLADLQKGLDSMLREPHGCFEQTSSSNYPNLLALDYMQEHNVAAPAFTRRAKELLQKGYARLIGFECPQKGYEWFGGDPGHEALTAYGLMEFRDMSRVWDVDPEMVQRTAGWLLARRDGQGGFQRNPQSLDSFGGAPQDITNAYIVWALSEAGQQGIDKETRKLVDEARQSDDPYLIALAAASACNEGDTDAGEELLEKLAQHQQQDGHLEGKSGTITRSGGLSLKVETTALAALAWLKSPKMTAPANQAIEWITGNRQGAGGFGSTQATVLALKTLLEHAKANQRAVQAGELILEKDGVEIGRTSFDAGAKQAIVIDHDELASELKSGENKLTIRLTGENQMPYALDIGYQTRQPQSDPACPVQLVTSLSAETVAAGETVRLDVELANLSGQGQPMTVAIVGLPAGLEPRVDQLDELQKAGSFDYYELDARKLVLYWRSLGPEVADDQKIDFQLDLIAEIPGHYTGPASRTYLYYTAEQKHWTDPLEIEITRN